MALNLGAHIQRGGRGKKIKMHPSRKLLLDQDEPFLFVQICWIRSRFWEVNFWSKRSGAFLPPPTPPPSACRGGVDACEAFLGRVYLAACLVDSRSLPVRVSSCEDDRACFDAQARD